MAQEDKELLLQDLCARLPYKVKVQYKGAIKEIQYIEPEFEEICFVYPDNSFTVPIADCKPFLRSILSMTEEEKDEFNAVINKAIMGDEPVASYQLIDWLNAHYFDYRGLIEKELAIAVTEEYNPYKE